MQVLHSVAELRAALAARRGTRGFVPTMGALHAGHTALIDQSVADNDTTVVSIYVNPTQFDNAADLEKYPLTLEADQASAASHGADFVFAPNYAEMYPDGFSYRVDETAFSRELCGAHRPGHFTGVLTVVMKLINIVRPDVAYFGEKDYQQLELIRGMAEAFFLETEIRGLPTVREHDGLALSSRNLNLDAASREIAPRLHELIDSELTDEEVRARLGAEGFDVDYVESKYGRRFAAAKLGAVRLIDNVARNVAKQKGAGNQ